MLYITYLFTFFNKVFEKVFFLVVEWGIQKTNSVLQNGKIKQILTKIITNFKTYFKFWVKQICVIGKGRFIFSTEYQ